MHTGVYSGAAILSVDTMLLVIMLIGLLRQAHLSFAGLWHLLYKQVIPPASITSRFRC